MRPPNKVPAYFSTRQLARRLSVSSRTVSRWIKAGELRAHYFGVQVRISEDDVESFLAIRRR